MLVFRNPGLIDLDAVRTMGVSVKRDGAFGFFGTGMKYAIATSLRNGAKVELWRGTDHHHLTTVEKSIRGEPFNIVCLDGHEIGFTDQLGKNWEPWMVLREFGCNALDEEGDFWLHSADTGPALLDRGDGSSEGETTLIISGWPELEQAYSRRDELFVTGDVILETPAVRVRAKPSQFLYYRGVRAYKLDRSAAFTYELLEHQHLTEDRTLSTLYYAIDIIAKLWLQATDMALLKKVLTAGPNYWEHSLDYEEKSTYRPASREFLEVCVSAKVDNERESVSLAPGAAAVLSKHMRKANEEEAVYSYSRYAQDKLGAVIEAFNDLFVTVKTDPLRLEEIKLMVLDDALPNLKGAMAEDGRVYISRDLLRKDTAAIATDLLPAILQLRFPNQISDDLIDLLMPAIVKAHYNTSPRRRSDQESAIDPAPTEEEASIPSSDAAIAKEFEEALAEDFNDGIPF